MSVFESRTGRAWRTCLVPLLTGVMTGGALDAQVDVVDAAQKISALEGGFGGSLGSGDRFGSAVASLGDLMATGNEFVAVGARATSLFFADAGAVWLLELDASGTVVSERELATAANGFGGTLDAFDAFGSSAANIGDLDGDGVVDLAVGAPGDSDGDWLGGAVWILFLNADGTVKSEAKISSNAGGFGTGLGPLDLFGASLTFLGDNDGDDLPELAVGAVGDGDGGPGRGAVWILELAADGSVASKAKISSSAGGFTGELDNFGQFGASLTALGDVDGNGTVDLAVGAPRDDDGGPGRGAFWTLFLAADNSVLSATKVSSTSGNLAGPLSDDARFGSALAALGDQDDDGTPDLLVGASERNFFATGPGSVWILFLGPDGSVLQEQEVTQDVEGFVGPLAAGDHFGAACAMIGDLDGDGLGEFLVGAPGDGPTGQGAAWVVFPTAPGVEVQNGSGVNPVLLQPGSDAPRINSFWRPFITLPTVVGGDPLVHFFAVSRRRSNFFDVSLGTVGELFISLLPEDLTFIQAVVPGELFEYFLPDDINLVGLECFSQGAILTTAGDLTLTNGLDFVVGF